jgi:hypothetical protein
VQSQKITLCSVYILKHERASTQKLADKSIMRKANYVYFPGMVNLWNSLGIAWSSENAAQAKIFLATYLEKYSRAFFERIIQ